MFAPWPAPSSSTSPSRSCTRASGERSPSPHSSAWSAVIAAARGPIAANESIGCAERRAPGHVRATSTTTPSPRAGETAGSYGGISARITGHHDSGTGGACHWLGSELWLVCVGTTSVPSGPSASSSAPTTACAPPHTQPSAESEVCASTTPPSSSPSRRRSAARLACVTGASMPWMTSASPIAPAWCQGGRPAVATGRARTAAWSATS